MITTSTDGDIDGGCSGAGNMVLLKAFILVLVVEMVLLMAFMLVLVMAMVLLMAFLLVAIVLLMVFMLMLVMVIVHAGVGDGDDVLMAFCQTGAGDDNGAVDGVPSCWSW